MITRGGTRSAIDVEYALKELTIDFFNEIGEIIIRDKESIRDTGGIPDEIVHIYKTMEIGNLFNDNITLINLENGKTFPSVESYNKMVSIIRTMYDDHFDNMVDISKITYLEYFNLVITHVEIYHKLLS